MNEKENISQLPDAGEINLSQLKEFTPEDQGRIIAARLLALKESDEKVAPQLMRLVESRDYVTLASGFLQSLERMKEKLITQYGEGDFPEWYATGEGPRVGREEMKRIQGENSVALLQALGAIDPGL